MSGLIDDNEGLALVTAKGLEVYDGLAVATGLEGGPATAPAFSPSLDFSQADNSQYIPTPQ